MEKKPVATRTERFLTFIFAALFFLNVVYLLLGIASIPAFYERVTTLTIEPYGPADEELASNALMQAEAASRGLTLSQYAIEQIVFSLAIMLVFGVVAGLIAWRAQGNWFAWFSAFLLLFIAQAAFTPQVIVAKLVSPAAYEIAAIFWPLMLLYIFLFPNGKPVPRIGLLFLAPILVLHFFFQASYVWLTWFPDSALLGFVTGLLGVFDWMIPIAFIVILVCQIYRYVRVSTPIEKQQTKWFLFGLAFIVLSFPFDPWIQASPFQEEWDLIGLVFVPLAVGVAILKYRLWDIDIIIRRTLTYGLVTALLLGVFFGSVILLQQIFAELTGSGQNEIVTVLSTLAIAALFVPLRKWVQNAIDRRFNRKKYDAQKVLNDFANTVRDETDLEKLTARLMQVVDETMEPKSVSVWLKADERRFAKEQLATADGRSKTADSRYEAGR